MFDKNSGCIDDYIRQRIKFNGTKKIIEYHIETDIFCGDHIFEMLNVINYAHKTYKYRLPIIFYLGEFEFYDKLVYVILETICEYLFSVEHQRIGIVFNAKHTIWSEGICFSPLKSLSNTKAFYKAFGNTIEGRHYRKLLCFSEEKDSKQLSMIMDEIYYFLKNNGIAESSSNELSEMLIELVGNAIEHGHSDTLIDIDITNTTYARDDGCDDVFYGMNIAILNYSHVLFYEPLKEKIEKNEKMPERYDFVKEAFEFHKTRFDKDYTESDFYTVSSFQDKISGSLTKNTGGRGLTTLLTSLEEKADTHLCYMLSGNRVLFLAKELLKFDDNKLVGFNTDGNYIAQVPDRDAFQTISTVLPGTAYNLSFVIRKEWNL